MKAAVDHDPGESVCVVVYGVMERLVKSTRYPYASYTPVWQQQGNTRVFTDRQVDALVAESEVAR
jgi:hypothetical protein